MILIEFLYSMSIFITENYPIFNLLYPTNTYFEYYDVERQHTVLDTTFLKALTGVTSIGKVY